MMRREIKKTPERIEDISDKLDSTDSSFSSASAPMTLDARRTAWFLTSGRNIAIYVQTMKNGFMRFVTILPGIPGGGFEHVQTFDLGNNSHE